MKDAVWTFNVTHHFDTVEEFLDWDKEKTAELCPKCLREWRAHTLAMGALLCPTRAVCDA